MRAIRAFSKARKGIPSGFGRPDVGASCQGAYTSIRWHNTSRHNIAQAPSLKDFMNQTTKVAESDVQPSSHPPYLEEAAPGSLRAPQKVFIESYGCQMNFGDSEIVLSVLQNSKRYNPVEGDFVRTLDIDEANVVLLMTCAVRENAEGKIFNRIDQLAPLKKQKKLKTVGILGCMAERLKEKLFDLRGHAVDVICGPDAYRDLPRLLDDASLSGQRGVNVLLSMDETYADIAPVRLDDSKHSAFVSIMRGCNNMCAFCIVPFTRGRERSRPIESIVDEVRHLRDEGIREITLLGQNVNSYHDKSLTQQQLALEAAAASSENVEVHQTTNNGSSSSSVRKRKSEMTEGEVAPMSRNFKTIYKVPQLATNDKRFVHLLEALADVSPDMRIRFTSPHPKDFPDGLLQLMRDRDNICKQIHLPAQSGSSVMLERMRRGYTREAYLDLVAHIRETLPQVAFSSDFIVGFCGETEEDHKLTLDLVQQVGFTMAYMFAYSMRPGTMAHRRYTDDVPAEVKQRRLQELIDVFYARQAEVIDQQLAWNGDREEIVLVEGTSKKSSDFFQGKIDNGRTVVFPIQTLQHASDGLSRMPEVGDFVAVKLVDKRGSTPIAVPQRILRGLSL